MHHSFPSPGYSCLATTRPHLALGQNESEIPIYYNKLEKNTSIYPVSFFLFKRKLRASLELLTTFEAKMEKVVKNMHNLKWWLNLDHVIILEMTLVRQEKWTLKVTD